MRFLGFLVAITSILIGLSAVSAYGQVSIVWNLDDYTGMTRTVPNLPTGSPVVLEADEIIDVIIMGDGYCLSSEFFLDASTWYDKTLGSRAIPPYTWFPEAFRVRAAYAQSADRVSLSRNSYYRTLVANRLDTLGAVVQVEVEGGGWWNEFEDNDTQFRNRIYDSIDVVAETGDLNRIRYGSGSGMEGRYKNLIIVMLCKGLDSALPACDLNTITVSGRAITVERIPGMSGTSEVRIAVGNNQQHEFGHAFASLKDEYIDKRCETSSRTEPSSADRSVFNLSNVVFERNPCNLKWRHLAPGGIYNSDPNSLVGNFFRGGGGREYGEWHSEYRCLMNGTHDNYECSACEESPADADTEGLRDVNHFCFWCQEIVSARILEKTGQLIRFGDPTEEGALGRALYSRWVDEIRNQYYTLFDIESQIAEKSECYRLSQGLSSPVNGSCGAPVPTGLYDCEIRQLGNAAYVDSGSGSDSGGDGSREAPFSSFERGLDSIGCSAAEILILKPAVYGPYTFSDPVTLLAEGSSTVSIGN